MPDEVVRRAEQVELVDITPEALRRRMAHGNVYAPEKVDAALANYFQPRNLTALREMALLWLADQVDVALQRYRTDQQITDTWEARERVVVALTGGPESETLLRRAARIAERSGRRSCSPCTCCAATASPGPRSGRWPGCAGSPRTSARPSTPSSATTCRRALLDFARGVNATQLVLGTSRRSRLARLFDEGIGARVVQDSGPIDVHMVTHAEAGRGIRLPAPVQRRPGRAAGPRAGRWAVLLPLAAVGGRHARPRLLGLSTDVVLFFLATVVVALVGGLGPALLAARRRRAAAQLLPHPAALHLHHRRAGERDHARGDGAGRGARRARRRPRRPPRPAGRAGPRRGRAARLVLPHRAHPAPTRCPGCWRRSARPSASPSVAILRAPRRPVGGVRLRRPAGLHPPRQADVDVAVDADIHLVGARPHAARRRPPAARRRRRPGPARAAQPADRRRGRRGRSAAPTPPSCAPRCSPRSATTCAPRWPRSRPRPAACATADLRLSDARPRRAGRHHRGVRRPAHRPGQQPARLLPARHRRGRPRRCSRSATTRWSPLALARPRRRGPRPGRDRRASCPRSSPTPACSSGSSPTSSTTRCATAAARRSRCAASAHADRVELRVVDRGPGVPRGAAGPAVRPVPAARRPRPAAGSASGCASRAGSSRPWAARSSPRTPRAAG